MAIYIYGLYDIYSLLHTLHSPPPILDAKPVNFALASQSRGSFAFMLCNIPPVFHSSRKTRISLCVRVYVCPQNTSNFVSRTPPTVLLQMYSNFAHTLITC